MNRYDFLSSEKETNRPWRPVNIISLQKIYVVIVITLMTTTLTSCSTMAPEYRRPEAPIPSQWSYEKENKGTAHKSAKDISWQQFYTDPKLKKVILLSLQENRDLRVAVLNIEKSRAQYQIKQSALVPEVDVNGSETAQRTPASVSSTGIGGVSRQYSLDVGISSYELDLFGRVRSLKDEALQDYLSKIETRKATQISLIGNVAENYLTLAADKELQKIAHDTLASRQKSLDLELALQINGNASGLDVREASRELEKARADALDADEQIETDRNALEIIVGKRIPDELLPAIGTINQQLIAAVVPAGLPSDLLQNRPDILAAEHTLMGENASIGAARAAFFPTISLTTSAGRASNDLSDLFSGGGKSWVFTPQISLPIFTGGRLSAELETSKVEQKIAVAEYEQTIQTAFREVSDVLARRQIIDNKVETLGLRAESAKESLELVQSRYSDGISSYLNVMEAQREDLSAQQSLIQSELSRQISLVTLYKVLGGGWFEPSSEKQTKSPDAHNSTTGS